MNIKEDRFEIRTNSFVQRELTKLSMSSRFIDVSSDEPMKNYIANLQEIWGSRQSVLFDHLHATYM